VGPVALLKWSIMSEITYYPSEVDWEDEGKILFDEFRKQLKENGRNPPLEWDQLTDTSREAWIKVAEKAHDRYWA